jgi:hypothetical protein
MNCTLPYKKYEAIPNSRGQMHCIGESYISIYLKGTTQTAFNNEMTNETNLSIHEVRRPLPFLLLTLNVIVTGSVVGPPG